MRYAAFMRALNVGGRVVKMDALKKIFGKIGFKGAESFIASGNIVFESPSKDRAAMEKKIAAGLEKALGYDVATFLRDFEELAAIGAAMPFKGIDDAPTYVVGFLHAPLDAAATMRLMGLASPVDRFAILGREVFWYSQIGQGESKFSANVFDKALGVRSTWRNLRTVRKMVARWG
jgi:uncharacterized protein (DUF1697 family)